MFTILLFLNAFTGCDSTSHVYGVGNKLAFQKLMKGDPILQSCANAFTLPGKNRTDIENFSSQVMAVMCGGKSTRSLAALRYDILTKTVISAKSFVMPERLPPNPIVSGCTFRP